MVRRTHKEVWDGSGDPRGGTGLVAGPSAWFGTGLETLSEVLDGLGDTRGGPGRVGYPRGGLVQVG